MVRAALEDARDQVAALFGVRPRQVVLTSGGTEAVNAAVWGRRWAADRTAARRWPAPPSSTRPCGTPRPASAPSSTIAVDGLGRITAAAVAEALERCRRRARPAAGARALPGGQPRSRHRSRTWPTWSGLLPRAGASPSTSTPWPPPATSRSTSRRSVPTWCRCRPTSSVARPAWARSILRRGLRIDPLLVGGEQERGRRAGLEDVAGAIGFGAAAAGAGRAGPDRRRGRGGPRAHRPPARRGAGGRRRRPLRRHRPAGAPHRLPRRRRASRPSRSCSGSTRPGWPSTRARPARRSPSSPRRCSRPWASTASGRCGCRSAGRPPTATSTPSTAAFAGGGRAPPGPAVLTDARSPATWSRPGRHR